MVTLKDGSQVEDPRLDRLIQFDERSRDYPLSDIIDRKTPRSYTWRITQPYLIDQYREGACVGLAVTNELQARPSEVDLGDKTQAELFALRRIYWEAQKIDPWAGGKYPGASPTYDGTSVLAGVQAAQRLGYFEEYRWTFSVEDLVIGLGRHGPAVLGMDWHDTNYEPDEDGFISPTGRVVGGHAILARAVRVEFRDGTNEETYDDLDLDRSFITVRNSWGVWGHEDSGDAYIRLSDMQTWLDKRMEAVFMVHRTIHPENN